MSREKDLNSKAATGQFFPIPFVELEHKVSSLNLNDGTGERLPIRMINANKIFFHGHLVLEIIPNHELSTYTLPKQLDMIVSKQFALSALTTLIDDVNDKAYVKREQTTQYSYYCAYLKKERLTLTRNDVRFKKDKFRDDSNFFSAFNLKNSVTIEKIL